MKIYNPYNRTSGGSNGGDNGGGFEYSAGDIYFGLNPPTNSIKLDGRQLTASEYPELDGIIEESSFTDNYEITNNNSNYLNEYDIFSGIQFNILKQIRYNNKEYTLFATENDESVLADTTDKNNITVIDSAVNGDLFNASIRARFLQGLANPIYNFIDNKDGTAIYAVRESLSLRTELILLDLENGTTTVLLDNTDIPFFDDYIDINQDSMIDLYTVLNFIHFIKDANSNDIYIFHNDSLIDTEMNVYLYNSGNYNLIKSFNFIDEVLIFNEADIELSFDIDNKFFYFYRLFLDFNDVYDSKLLGIYKYDFGNNTDEELIEDMIDQDFFLYTKPAILYNNDLYYFKYFMAESEFTFDLYIDSIYKYSSSGIKTDLGRPETFFYSIIDSEFDNIQEVFGIRIINDTLFIHTTNEVEFDRFEETIGYNLNTKEMVFSTLFGEPFSTYEGISTPTHFFFTSYNYTHNYIANNENNTLNTYGTSFNNPDEINYIEMSFDLVSGIYELPNYNGDDQGFIKAYLII